MYSRDVVFREDRSKSMLEENFQTENNPKTMWFELRNKEDNSDESTKLEEEVEQPTLVVRRSKRERKLVERYSLPNFRSTYVLTTINNEPKSVGEVVDSIEGKLWKDPMVEEMESLHKNETWDLVKLSSGRKHVRSKWVFKKKMKTKSQVEKFKARLVAKGYSQVKGVDFGEIFSLVAKLTSIRVLISLATTFDMEIEQMDVKTTFLHGDLEEEIYMKNLGGFIVKGKKYLVCKLERSLYGLN
jgi:hypothetical protein